MPLLGLGLWWPQAVWSYFGAIAHALGGGALVAGGDAMKGALTRASACRRTAKMPREQLCWIRAAACRWPMPGIRRAAASELRYVATPARLRNVRGVALQGDAGTAQPRRNLAAAWLV